MGVWGFAECVIEFFCYFILAHSDFLLESILKLEIGIGNLIESRLGVYHRLVHVIKLDLERKLHIKCDLRDEKMSRSRINSKSS